MVAYIDTARKDYNLVLNRFVSNSITEYLTNDNMVQLSQVYRNNRENFKNNEVVRQLNEKIKDGSVFTGRNIGIDLREDEINKWRNDLAILLDNLPIESMGLGTQNMFKTEVFMKQNTSVDIVVIEEPENNLSYTNMSILISNLKDHKDKQIFISTHSSFVANKLGLKYLKLVNKGRVDSFTSLDSETYKCFIKLPGYDTLRIVLGNKIILVEGPTDELIVHRAYLDNDLSTLFHTIF